MTASEPLTLEEEYEMQISWRNDNDKCTFIVLKDEQMIGDVNLFIHPYDNQEGVKTGEIEVMIAEKESRGKGHGKSAVIMMLHYGFTVLNIERVRARISMKNENSIKMFEKLGFLHVSRSEVFEEVTLELHLNNAYFTGINIQYITNEIRTITKYYK
jgi:RimJ/RimL family protein N-acetyltransferase